MTNEPRPTLGDVLVERLANVMDQQPYVCPDCDEQACVCWAYDDQGETMKDQQQEPEPTPSEFVALHQTFSVAYILGEFRAYQADDCRDPSFRDCAPHYIESLLAEIARR